MPWKVASAASAGPFALGGCQPMPWRWASSQSTAAASSGASGRASAKARAASAVVSASDRCHGCWPAPAQKRRGCRPGRSARPCARGEHAEDLAGERHAVEVGERQGQVGERRVGEALADAVQGVGLLEGRLVAGAQGVQQRGAGLVVAAVDLGELLGQVGRRLVQGRGIGQQAERLGGGERPDDARRGQAVARPGLAASAGDPGPAAVLVLER